MDNGAIIERFEQWQKRSLYVGLAAAAVCAVAFLVDRRAFFRGYLVGYLFWWKVSVGFLSISLLRWQGSRAVP